MDKRFKQDAYEQCICSMKSGVERISSFLTRPFHNSSSSYSEHSTANLRALLSVEGIRGVIGSLVGKTSISDNLYSHQFEIDSTFPSEVIYSDRMIIKNKPDTIHDTDDTAYSFEYQLHTTRLAQCEHENVDVDVTNIVVIGIPVVVVLGVGVVIVVLFWLLVSWFLL
ncbi:Hypothetical predicted protein [Octopus vulgaris]|uniref:Uncharacterized protein n=1 Tax=Octopus vulgaris TaxID=6645 RepID=A0AA36B2G4_OCTVU|nr:Hypothetical predicted protein [Octopus vulgaris]